MVLKLIINVETFFNLTLLFFFIIRIDLPWLDLSSWKARRSTSLSNGLTPPFLVSVVDVVWYLQPWEVSLLLGFIHSYSSRIWHHHKADKLQEEEEDVVLQPILCSRYFQPCTHVRYTLRRQCVSRPLCIVKLCCTQLFAGTRVQVRCEGSIFSSNTCFYYQRNGKLMSYAEFIAYTSWYHCEPRKNKINERY